MVNRFQVFPVSLKWNGDEGKVTKRPMLFGWQNPERCAVWSVEELNDAMSEPQDSGLGLGVLCGGSSQLVVIDFDVGDEVGFSMRKSVESVPGLDRDTMIVKTQSGGLHFYYRSDRADKIKTGTGLMPNVDVRAKGGFVVGPGSSCATPEGVKSYEILRGSWDAIATLPDELEAFLEERGFITPPPSLSQMVRARTMQDVNVDPDEVADALSHINLVGDGDYTKWFTVACALESKGLWTEFHQWSMSQPGYVAGECEKQWRNVKTNRVNSPVTIATVFKMARDAGWEPTKKKGANDLALTPLV